VISTLTRIELVAEAPPPAPAPLEMPRNMVASHAEPEAHEAGDLALAARPQGDPEGFRIPVRNQEYDPNKPDTWAATPRNALCPCGSGKKYKHCHGALA